jgi:hypothetical protein
MADIISDEIAKFINDVAQGDLLSIVQGINLQSCATNKNLRLTNSNGEVWDTDNLIDALRDNDDPDAPHSEYVLQDDAIHYVDDHGHLNGVAFRLSRVVEESEGESCL